MNGRRHGAVRPLQRRLVQAAAISTLVLFQAMLAKANELPEVFKNNETIAVA